jgi:bacillithiol biosynthesis cysteine-adding enzyme BshC
MATVANHEAECLPTPGELSVKVDCLSFTQVPHTAKLFLDFLSYSPKVRDFYPSSPNICDGVSRQTPEKRYDSARRERVSDVLERQNRSWSASAKSLANIERLRAGASAVVTGQQVGLFGGPFFSLLKALTAVKHAEEARAAGVDAVPIFWLATNDHDLAEVNHTTILSSEGLRKIATPSRSVDDAPVGTVTFGPEIEEVVKSAIDVLGPVPAMDLLRESYRPGETLGSAFARLFSALFGEFGVVLMDPSDADLHSIAHPIYAAAIERAHEIDEALLARGKELESAGYHQQVKVTPSSTLLFAMKDGARIPVHRRVNGSDATSEFLIKDEKFSKEQMLRRIADKPDDFSPNVLLRPIVQDHLLPTLAYTGGSAEVAYFAQVGVVYEKLLGKVTPILPRFSATVVEPKAKSLLERYHLELTDAFRGEDALREKAAASTLPDELQGAFDRAAQSLEQSFSNVKDALTRLDKTLVEAADNAASKMQHQLESLRARAARAELRQSEVIGRHAQQLSNSLFPNKVLQEREIGAVYFLARYGVEFLQTLHDTLQSSCHDHQVVTFD